MFRKADQEENPPCPFTDDLRYGDSLECKRQQRVAHDGLPLQQAVVLKNKGNPVGPDLDFSFVTPADSGYDIQ